MQVVETTANRHQRRARAFVLLFALSALTLNFIFFALIYESDGALEEILIAGFSGVLVGELCVIVLLSGFTGRSSLGGYFRGVILALLWYAALAVGLYGVEDNDSLLLPMLSSICLMPWLLLVASLPVIGLRQLGWRLAHRAAEMPESLPFRIADLFHATAIAAVTLTLIRVPAVANEVEVTDFFPQVLIVSGVVFLVGLCVMPLAVWLAFGISSRTKSMIGLVIFAVSAYLIIVLISQCFYDWNASWDSRTEVLLPIAVLEGATIAVLYTFMISLSLSGIELIRKRRVALSATHADESHQKSKPPVTASTARRRWQIAVAILAAVLINIALARLETWRRVQDQKNERLSNLAVKLSGSIQTNDHQVIWIRLGEPATDVDFKQFADCRSVEGLNLTAKNLTDASLEQLSHFHSVSHLSLDGAAITDAGLAHLASLRDLDTLTLTNVPISGHGFSHLSKLQKLNSLHLSNSTITNQGISHLPKLGGLTSLDLSKTAVSGSGLAHIAGAVPVESLVLDQSALSDEDCFAFSRMRNLQHLSLNRTAITDKGLRQIIRAPNLFALQMQDTSVDGTGLQLSQSLWRLDLSGTRVNDESISSLVELTKLNALSLRNTKITDKAVAQLIQIQTLGDLDLGQTQISDVGVAGLAKLTALNQLKLSGTTITGECFRQWPGSPQLNLDVSDTEITDATLPSISRMGVRGLTIDGTNVTVNGILSAKFSGLESLQVRAGQFSEAEIAQLETSLGIHVVIHDPQQPEP